MLTSLTKRLTRWLLRRPRPCRIAGTPLVRITGDDVEGGAWGTDGPPMKSGTWGAWDMCPDPDPTGYGAYWDSLDEDGRDREREMMAEHAADVEARRARGEIEP